MSQCVWALANMCVDSLRVRIMILESMVQRDLARMLAMHGISYATKDQIVYLLHLIIRAKKLPRLEFIKDTLYGLARTLKFVDVYLVQDLATNEDLLARILYPLHHAAEQYCVFISDLFSSLNLRQHLITLMCQTKSPLIFELSSEIIG